MRAHSARPERARTPWQVFADLTTRALRPLAQKKHHPEAFWRGGRLVALDGTQFSLSNTPANNAARPRSRRRRGRAAFAKLTTGVLLEVGLHNPLAAAIGQNGQSEWQLTLRKVRVRVGRKKFPTQTLRLWTSRLDPQQAPAAELAPLYAQRWEHEWYYRHLKGELGRGSLLLSHTVPTVPPSHW